MRLPKYRIWHKKEKKMYGEYYDGFVDYIRACGEPDIAGIDVQVIDETGECQNYSFDEVEIMQFTGLKDKNGLTDIYEGDIIDIEGNIKGNIYEINKTKIDLVVQRVGTKTWCSTYQKAMERGCKNAE